MAHRRSRQDGPRRDGRAFFGLLDARRLGLGVGQGRLLVHPDHHPARLHPGPRLLLRRQPDDRPRDPRLEPINFCPPENQTLPCPAPVGAVDPVGDRAGARSHLPAAADRRRRSSSPGRSCCTSAAPTPPARRPTRPSSSTVSGPGNFDAWTRRAGAARGAHRRRRSRSPAARSSWPAASARTAIRPTDVRPAPRAARPASSASGRRAEEAGLDIDLPGGRRRCGARRRADGLILVGGTTDGTTPTSRSGSRPTTGAARSQPWVQQADLYHGGDGPLGGRHRVATCGSTAGPPRTARRRPSSAASSGPRRRRRRSSGSASPAAATDLPGAADQRRRVRGERRACTSSAAPTGRRPRPSCTGRSPTRTATSPSGSTSPRATCRSRAAASPARRRVVLGPDAVLIGGETGSGPTAAARPGEPRPAGAVLPARPRRRNRAGAQDRRRDRPAAGLPRRERRRHRQLRDPAVRRLGVRPPGEGRGVPRLAARRGAPAASPAIACERGA